ncbi:MAG: DNA repair protein RadC [Nitrospira sp.]|nr:MAG: DNA repair protein RadC [Nitrospira sp.]
MSKRIDQIPKQDRPREKLLAKGAGALSDQELLAVLLGKGSAQLDVMTLAAKLARVLDEKGLGVRIEDLTGFDGVGEAKAALVLAAIEFVRRRIKPEGLKINTPADVLPLIRHFADRKQEHFLAVTINGANEVLNVRVVSIGLIDRSPVHPREVFADALTDRASGIIVAHNHPAGSLEPSPSDMDATKQIKEAGEIIGIEVLDHIIFNRKGYYSFLEKGCL